MRLSQLIYALGMRVRNKRILPNYRFLLESQSWPIERLRAHQLSALRRLLLRANEKSAFYRDRFRSCGVKPEAIASLSDLRRIPPTSKEELLEHAKRIQLNDLSEKMFYSETSGSTGKPLIFYRNQDWDAWHNASVLRGFSWYGVEPWERNGYLWGYNLSVASRLKTRWLDALQNRFRLFSYSDSEIDVFARKLTRASYLGGYSSMIYEIAKRVNAREQNELRFELKLIRGTSEKIFDSYQEEAVRAFGTRITSEYGAAEAGIIAFECPERNMHVNMETIIVEEEDNQIIATNLTSLSFPVIRYKLGDYIKLDRETRCDCGRAHDIITEVTGRIGKVIAGHRNEYPSLTLYYVFKNLAMDHELVLNYQAIQKRKGALDLCLDGKLGDGERRLVEAECLKYFGADLDVQVLENCDLRSTTRKKHDFISEL